MYVITYVMISRQHYIIDNMLVYMSVETEQIPVNVPLNTIQITPLNSGQK